MNNYKSIEIHNLGNEICMAEAWGLSNVFGAYCDHCPCETIMEIGFNKHTGYIYIALENGITLASCLGGHVQYIVINEEGDEIFRDTYERAMQEFNNQ